MTMTDAICSPLIPLYHDLSLRIVRSREVPLAEVTMLLDQLYALTAEQNSLCEWMAPSPPSDDETDRILQTSMSTAACICWMFRHQPLPLLIWQDIVAAALFMDVGLVALTLAERRKPALSAEETKRWRANHSELSAAYVSSVTGLPSAVLRMIRHHHTRLNAKNYAIDLHPGDRLLAVAVRTVAALCDSSQSFAATANKTAANLVAETLAGDWDRRFVEPILAALSFLAATETSFTEHATVNAYRLDGQASAMSPPHIRPRTREAGENRHVGKHLPMELAGPHYLLSEQPFIRRPHASERSLAITTAEPSDDERENRRH